MCCAMTGDHTFIPQPFDNSETKVASCRRSRLWPSASQSCNLSTAPFRIQHSSNEVRRNSQQPFHRPNPVEAHCKGCKVLRTWLVESAFSASSRRASACSWVSCCISSYQTNSTNGANSKQNEIAVHMLQAFRASCKCVQIPKLRISSWFVSVLGGLVAIIFLDFLRAEQMRTNVTVQVGSWILIIHILVSKHTQISVVSFIIEVSSSQKICVLCLWPVDVSGRSALRTCEMSTRKTCQHNMNCQICRCFHLLFQVGRNDTHDFHRSPHSGRPQIVDMWHFQLQKLQKFTKFVPSNTQIEFSLLVLFPTTLCQHENLGQ